MSTLGAPRTLEVIFSTWSLRYLLSSTELPSHCSATWNAWLASSLKPSWNCALTHHRPLHLPPSSSHVCRSRREDSCTAAQSTGKQTRGACIRPHRHPTGFIMCIKVLLHVGSNTTDKKYSRSSKKTFNLKSLVKFCTQKNKKRLCLCLFVAKCSAQTRRELFPPTNGIKYVWYDSSGCLETFTSWYHE